MYQGTCRARAPHWLISGGVSVHMANQLQINIGVACEERYIVPYALLSFSSFSLSSLFSRNTSTVRYCSCLSCSILIGSRVLLPLRTAPLPRDKSLQSVSTASEL